MRRHPSFIAALVVLAGLCAAAHTASAQGRFLAKEDILLYGLGLKVDPATQTVPKDIATIVSTYLQAPQQPTGLPPFAPDAVVKGTLRGPGLPAPLDLQAQPNSPLQIPPLTVAGVYSLDNLRLESQGTVLLRATPESVRITVIDKLLVTQITARALTAAEIREKGIVFDASNFQAYNFTAAFALKDGDPIKVNFPVLLPSVQPVSDVSSASVTIGTISPPSITSLKTVVPDTLKLATQVPNLTVMGFQLTAPELKGQDLMVPPIPGVIVIPGDIGFLNQYFSVMLMVGNAAPLGSGLRVADLRADIVLPPGNDRVANTLDDPLRMAMTTRGEAPRSQPVVQAGLDGQLGTADDIVTLGPGESGNAEFLVEGRREGSHTIEMSIAATLLGLPVGPVAITGRAIGAVLVRNPTFTLTFTHPETVVAGEQYALDVTVTNTSSSPANFVSINLLAPNVSGATVLGEATRQIDSIAAGDSASVSFDLVSRVTGKVTAATLDSDENVSGRFQLKTAVGADGVPLSPDSLVLPSEASALPKSVREAALGLLGKAWAVATAPAGVLPKDVTRFSKQMVIDRAVEVAEAGLRVSLHEPAPDSAAQLLMDFAGSNYGRIAELYPATDQAFQRDNYAGFDALRRSSVRGDVFAAAVAKTLAPALTANGAGTFHRALGSKWNYRPGFVSILLSSASAPAPFDVAIVDAQGRQVGGTGANGKLVKQIPFSEVLPYFDVNGLRIGTQLVLSAPEAGTYTVRLTRVAGTSPTATATLSVLAPTGDQNGDLRELLFDGLTAATAPSYTPSAGDPIRFAFVIAGDDAAASPAPVAAVATLVPDAAPGVVSIVQQADADVVSCEPDGAQYRIGRVVAVLFSEEVTAASVQDRAAAELITAFAPEANRAVAVALQPGRRVAFVAMSRPFGPYVPRTMTVIGVEDLRHHAMAGWTGAMEATVGENGAVVSGRVIQGDGTPVANANVRLYLVAPCQEVPGFTVPEKKIGISSQQADAEGRYSWDFVNSGARAVITAVDPVNEEFRSIPFEISRPGQRMNVDIVLLGRATFSGRVLAADGRTPLPGSQLRVTSLTDHSEYGATTDAHGAFVITRVPVGNIFVEAVNVTAKAHYNFSEYLPFAGATVTRDITLVPADVQQRDVKYGTFSGYVLKTDGATPVPDAPVVAYYQSGSQAGVSCPPVGDEIPVECAVGLSKTGVDGAFRIADLPAGGYRLYAFDQPSLAQGEVRYTLPAGAASVTILLSGGLGTVRGVVMDSTGAKVPGARVGGGLTLTTADANGAFVLTDVPVGRRTIVAVSDALGVTGSADVDIVSAGEVVNVSIVLPVSGAIAGQVVLADGTTPAANVAVYAFRKTGGGSIQVLGQATTSVTGAYRIDHLPAEEYEVSAFAADFSDGNIVPAVLRYDKQVLRVDIRFRGAGGRVSGTVFNSDGTTPLAARVGLTGARVQVAGGKVGVGFVPVANFAIADTTADGKFSFGGLIVGDFTLRAVGAFSPDPIESTGRIETPGQQVNVNLRLQASSQVSGIVYLPDGATPAPNVNVTFKSDAFRLVCSDPLADASGDGNCTPVPQGVQAEFAVTDATGRFLIPLVNAGAFTLSFEDPATGKVARARGSVRPGERAEIPVRLLGRGVLTIHVLGSDGRSPVPGARVDVKQADFPQAALSMVADATGTLVLGGGDALSEGEVAIAVRDTRNGFTGRGSARIARDNEAVSVNVYIFDAWGTVSGTVFKADGITPAPNAEVVISVGGKAIGYTVADANARFSQDTIPLGAFAIDAFEAATGRIGYASGSIDLDKQQVTVNVVELAMGLVTGTALDASIMSPLPGWSVALTPALGSGRSLPALRGMTAGDGRFSFPGVSQGSFALHVSKDGNAGSASAEGRIYAEGQLLDIPLLVQIPHPLYGRIDGSVRNPDGTPASFASVQVAGGAQTVTAADGTFSFPQLALGRYRLDATAQNSGNAGSVWADLQLNGDVVQVTIPMIGLTAVHGQVVNADNSPAPGAQVTFVGVPASGCDGGCTKYSDANGAFAFSQLPARSFTVWASDPVRGLKGSVGGALNPGEDQALRLVLQPSAVVQGRVLSAGGVPAAGITCELVVAGQHLFIGTAADGRFSYPAVPLGAFSLDFSDPIGTGIARRNGTITGDLDFSDIRLDEAPPQVVSLTPTASASRVPLDQALTIVFSEPIDPAGVTANGISLAGPAGPVTAVLALVVGDTTVTLSPVGPLKDESRYTLKVTGIKDRLGKLMPDYAASFTTLDMTPPVAAEVSPAQGGSGVPIYSPVRVKFSEPIDTTAWGAAPLSLTLGGNAVAGRLDYLYGNTVVAFTPSLPLADNATYRVRLAPAKDLAGNTQAQGLDFSFSTTDRVPPQIVGLLALSGPSVIENAIARVRPDFGGAPDVAVVDYYVNGAVAGSSRTTPFDFAFQVVPALGKPGDAVSVTAIATDTSGNRGPVSPALAIPITADVPPAVQITAPAAGSSFGNGARVTVTVHATDDVGLAALGYKAVTGRTQDSAATLVSPAVTDRTATYAFDVPNTAAPGSTIEIQASAADTKGQTTPAAPVSIRVVDAVAPTVSISGSASGDRVRPGQSVTVTMRADDAGGVASLTFAASGAAAYSDSRAIDGAIPSVVTSFTFTVPAGARSGDTLLLDGTATDRAGNTGSASRVVLTVADLTPPSLSIRTSTGSRIALPGQVLSILGQASDDTAVVAVDLSGQGAFTCNDSRQVTPPSNSASVSFSLTVPAQAVPGQILSLSARATDLAGNVSTPATLAITIVSGVEVTMPPSLVAVAGEEQQVAFQLSAPAGVGGQAVTFTSANPEVATATGAVTVPEGQSDGILVVSGVAGGTTAVRAFVQGAERASMTVAVQGGVVSGRVVNGLFEPVAGVAVTVANTQTAVTDGAGQYRATGVTATSFGVKALDAATGARGYATATLTAPGGYAKNVNMVLVSAGLVTGTVFQADGLTPAGPGIQIDIAAQARPWESLGTAFTDGSSRFEFPLVMLGEYYLTASATDGSRGRSPLSVTAGGAALDVPITYLGSGTVTGTVRSGAGAAVPNALVQFNASSAFGPAPVTNVVAGADGTFRFERVLIGAFSIVARDPVSGLAGVAEGSITRHGQTVSRDIAVGSYGSVSGTVYRSDGATAVANAEVSVAGQRTATDANGRYAFPIVPLGTHTISVSEAATRGVGRGSVTLGVNGENRVADVFLEPQGTLIVRVEDAGGQTVAGANVTVTATANAFSDTLSGTTGADGLAVIEHVLAGACTVTASASGLSGVSACSLPAGASLPVTVRLQPTASLAGIVFLPDGESPAAGTVRVNGVTQAIRADGSFRYDGLRLGSYSVSAYDAEGRLRAEARGITLYSAGQVVAQNLTFVALGTVNGRVFYNTAGAGNLSVQLRSLNPSLGGYLSASTDGAGYYEIGGVPAGGFTVSVADAARRLRGEASGAIATDGQVVTTDVNLVNNAITLPVDRFDANGLKYDIQADGSVATGTNAFYTEHGLKLDVLGASSITRVAAGGVATSEQGGQQVVVRQDGVAGLNVTRKIYVPLDGYFVRYTEILSNPTAAPITIGLRISSQLGWAQMYSARVPSVRATSSGDAAFNPLGADGDRWLVLDDSDGDPFVGTGQFPPATAFVLGGGGAIQPGAGGYDTSTGRLQYQWEGITVPAGGQAAIMHFGVQQISQAAARASAERLVQLPPEAIDGLTPDEIAAVGNFTMPANGISALPPLPSLRATVVGRVLEGDGSSPVADATVSFRSNHPLFGRTLTGKSASSGAFSFTGAATLGQYGGVPVAAWDFVLAATHPLTRAASPETPGSFADGQSTVTTDVVFHNAGLITGSIRLHGVPVTAGTVTLLNGGGQVATVGLDALGVFRFGGVVAGSYTLRAAIPHAQGTGLTGAAAIDVVAGSVQTFDVPVEPTGSIRGTVVTGAGAAAANVLVELVRSGFARSTRSDSSGNFGFTEVPVGTFTVQATEPTSTVRTSASVNVADGVETVQDLALAGVGIVQGVVRTTGGSLAGAGHSVTLSSSVAGATTYQTVTDGASSYRFTGVPVGSVTVTVRNDTQFIFGQAAGAVGAAGDTVTLDVTVADSSVALPVTLVDANGLAFDIQQNGRTAVGTQRAFYGNGGSTGGASLLDIVAGGTANRFNGAARGGQEDGNREIAIVQSGLGGLNVMRKVYVPADGYFARYLEILSNPGTAPVTVAVRVSHYVGWWDTRPGIFSTSSGDKVLDNWVAGARDLWVVLNGTDVPDALNLSSAYPSRAFAFDGPGAAQRAGWLTHTATSYPSLVVEWQNVTLQPGEKAAFLHFVVQQSNNAAGQASVERLVQLPPEATAGLSDEERTIIRNFAVPADGSSPVTPLPALNGQVAGRVLNENATGMIGATVTLQSKHPIFARQYSAATQTGGAFTLPATSATSFPVYPFTLQATLATRAAGLAEGHFAEGQATASQDVVITGAGSISGTVRHMDGTPWSGLNMDLSGNGIPTQTPTTRTGADFTFENVPAGTYTLSVWRNDNGCGLVSWVTPVTVSSGQATSVQTQPANVGRILGRLYSITGLPVANASVMLKGGPVGSNYSCYVATAADGSFDFLDIPAATLQMWNSRSGSIASVDLTLAAGQTITQDLTQAPIGTVVVKTTDGSGNALSGVSVSYMHTTMTNWATSGTTDALGQRTIANFPSGPFTVRALNVSNSSYAVTGTGTVTTEGQVVTVDLVVGGAGGTVTGTFRRPVTGAVVPSASVYLYTADGSTRLASGTTNTGGAFTFTNVPTGVPLVLRGEDPTGYSWPSTRNITVPAPGATLTQDLTALALATVRVTVLNPDGTPMASGAVYRRFPYAPYNSFYYVGRTNASGVIDLTKMPQGTNVVRVFDPVTGNPYADRAVTVTAADEAQVLPLEVRLGAFLTGTITGHVYGSDGVTPALGATVALLNALEPTGSSIASTTTAADGSYTFANYRQPESGFVVRAVGVGPGSVLTAPAVLTSNGQTLTVDLTLPTRVVRLVGRVLMADGVTAMPGARSFQLMRGDDNSWLTNVTTAADGSYATTVMIPSGLNTIFFRYSQSNPSVRVDTAPIVLPASGPLTADLVLPLYVGSVSGVVTAADGVTPMYNLTVQVLDSGNTELARTYTGTDGRYQFAGLVGPSSGVTVTATFSSGQAQSSAVSFATVRTQTLNFTFPLSVIRGRVLYANGNAVNSPSVSIEGSDGVTRWRVSSGSDWFVFGTPVGPFYVTATDGSQGSAVVTASGTVADITVPVVLDLTLPPTGTVVLTLRDAQGASTGAGSGFLTLAGDSYVRWANADALGRVTFNAVPAGRSIVQAKFGAASNLWAVGAVEVIGGQTVSVDLQAPMTGSVAGHAYQADGLTPIVGATVRFEGFTGAGPGGRPTATATTDASGAFSFPTVPMGSALVSIDSQAWAQGSVAPGASTTVDLVANMFSAGQLNGADGFKYEIYSTGSANYDGTISGNYAPLAGAYSLYVNGAGVGGPASRGTEMNGRQVVIGPQMAGSFVVTRKLYVPPAGGFERFLEVVRNPTATALPLTLNVPIYLAANTGVHLVAAPAGTGNRYVVADDSNGHAPARAAVAIVAAGAGASRLPVQNFTAGEGQNKVAFTWKTTLPPGAEIAFLHFFAQRAPNAAAEAVTQAEAIVNLTDPSVLDGLTPGERARVVNFILPGAEVLVSGGSINGRVMAADAAMPVAQAKVEALDPRDGVVRGTAWSSASGSYTLTGLEADSAGLVVTAAIPSVPGSKTATRVTFPAGASALTGVDLTLPVSGVQGQVSGGDATGFTVLAAQTTAGAEVTVATTVDASGRFTFFGLNPGPATFTLLDPNLQAGSILAAEVSGGGQTTNVTVPLSAGAVCQPALPGLVGWWRGESQAADALTSPTPSSEVSGVLYDTGKVGLAFRFAGSGRVIADDRTQLWLTSDASTLSAWVRIDNLVPDTQSLIYRTRSVSTDTAPAYELQKAWTSGGHHFLFRTFTPTGAQEAALISTREVTAGRFYHVAVTLDGPVMRLYVDGVLEASTPRPGFSNYRGGQFHLGGQGTTSTAPSANCNCTIDEVQLFDYAMPASHVHAILAGGEAGTCVELSHVARPVLPTLEQGWPYQLRLGASTGFDPSAVSFSVAGGSLPDGISLSTGGVLSGTTLSVGSYSFQATASAPSGAATRAFTLDAPACLSLPAGAGHLFRAEDNANDAIGGASGTVSGAVAYVAGRTGRAFSFPGTAGAYVLNPVTPAFSNNFTVEFWAKPSATRQSWAESTTTAYSGDQRFAVGGAGASSIYNEYAGVSVGTNGVSVYAYSPSASAHYPVLVYNAALPDWTHVAVVFANRTPTLYLNGVAVRTGLKTSRVSTFPSLSLGSEPTNIGPYQGLLDEVAFYSRPLAPSEVLAIYKAGGKTRCQ